MAFKVIKSLFLSLLVTIFSLNVSARGGDTRGGGDSAVGEFKTIALEIAYDLKKLGGVLDSLLKGGVLSQAIIMTPVVPVYPGSLINSLSADGKEKHNYERYQFMMNKFVIRGVEHEAIFDYNTREIFLNVELFNNNSNKIMKRRLVLHEYLRAMGENDDNDLLSIQIISMIELYKSKQKNLF